jgi:hypothetical protein
MKSGCTCIEVFATRVCIGITADMGSSCGSGCYGLEANSAACYSALIGMVEQFVLPNELGWREEYKI